MKTEKYLPIGSVVLLKDATKRIMIVGFVGVGSTDNEEIYDYIGCLYPEGVISSDKNLLFNHDQIDKVYYMGYVDDEQKEFKIKLNEFVSNGGLDTNTQNVSVEYNNLEKVPNEQPVQQSQQQPIETVQPIQQSQPAGAPVFDTLNFYQQ